MKTTIIKILNQIANGEEPPKKIYYKQVVYEYDEDEKDYANESFNEYLFDSHVITDILNDEVEILEATITYKQDKLKYKVGYKFISSSGEEDEILEITDYINPYLCRRSGHCSEQYIDSCIQIQDKIKKLEEKSSEIRFAIQHLGIETVLSTYSSKINEIIDKVSKYD